MSARVDALSACPFCGGNGMLRAEITAPRECNHYVQCKQCGVATACQPDEAIAALAWNRRVHGDAVAELIEAANRAAIAACRGDGSHPGTIRNADLDALRAALARIGDAA